MKTYKTNDSCLESCPGNCNGKVCNAKRNKLVKNSKENLFLIDKED